MAAAVPDFDAMTKAQIAKWLAHADDIRPYLAWARPGDEPTQVEQVVTVKMPSGLVARIDRAAGDDRSGRSGVIRAAVTEWLDRQDNKQKVA